MSTNEFLLRAMRSSVKRTDRADAGICHTAFTSHTSPGVCLSSTPVSEVSASYVRALSAYETVLRDLIQYNALALIKASVFDEDLISTMHVVAQEKLESTVDHRGLGFLWSLLTGQSHSLSHLARNKDILDNIGVYSMRSLRYVQSIYDALEMMQHRLEELRMVATGALVSESADPEVVLEMLAKGLERLGRARSGTVGGAALIGQ